MFDFGSAKILLGSSLLTKPRSNIAPIRQAHRPLP